MHHFHMSGNGLFDFQNPKKLGFLGICDKMEQRGFNNQDALNAVKRVGHYAIPATTGALGGLAGTAMGR